MPSDEHIARAQAHGRACARTRRGMDACPYTDDEPVLRHRWTEAYVGAGGGAQLAALPGRAWRAFTRWLFDEG